MAEKQPGTYSTIIGDKISSIVADVKQLISNGDAALAVKRVGRGLAIQPRDHTLYQLRGEAYVALGDYPSAIQNTRKAISLVKDETIRSTLIAILTGLYGCYGDEAHDKGEYQLALKNFRTAIELSPGEREYRLKSISCLFAMGLNKECLSMVEAELVTEYYTTDLLLTRAKLYLASGRVTDCYHDVETVLSVENTNPVARQLMTHLQLQSSTAKTKALHHSLVGRDKASIRKLDTAISADPHNPYYHVLRGAAHRKLLSYSLAVDDFLVAMDKCRHQFNSNIYRYASRQLVLTYNEFAMHCFWRGYYSDGVALLNKAIKEEKQEYGLYMNRGDCFFKLNEHQFALADFNQAQLLLGNKNTIDLAYRLCVTHYTLGMKAFRDKATPTALRHFTHAISHSPQTARLYTCRARTKYDLKDHTGARQDVLRSLLLDSTCDDVMPLVARLFPGSTPAQLLTRADAKSLRPSLIGQLVEGEDSCNEREKDTSTPLERHLETIMNSLHYPEDHEDSSVTVMSDTESDQSAPQLTEDDRTLPPRAWSILALPPPLPAPSDQSELSPAKPHSPDVKEDQLHSLIYYTKKSIKDEVDQLLQSRLKYPPRLKLKAIEY